MKRVGIDIGATVVRVVEVDGLDRDGNARVTKIGVIPLGHNAVSAGRIRNPLTVAQSVSRALRKAGVSGYGAIVGVASAQTALGRVDIPAAVHADERSGVIRNGRREISPTVLIEQSKMSVSYVGPGFSSEQLPVARTVVALAERQAVDAIVEVCRLGHVAPRALDLSAAALMRALVRAPLDNADVHTIIDIGDSKTIVTTREGMNLRSARVVNAGGSNLTRAIQTAAQINQKDAESLKRVMRLTGALQARRPMEATPGYGSDDIAVTEVTQNETLVEEALHSAANALIDSIAQSVEMDAAQAHSMTQGITVVGGGGQLLGIRERLANRIGVPVTHGDPWAVVVPSRNTQAFLDERGQVDPVFLSSLSVAIGLALWQGVGD